MKMGRRMSNVGKLAFALVAVVAGLILVSVNVAGQQITASIRGTVLDPSGATVQGAMVTAKQTETGLIRAEIGRASCRERVSPYV